MCSANHNAVVAKCNLSALGLQLLLNIKKKKKINEIPRGYKELNCGRRCASV